TMPCPVCGRPAERLMSAGAGLLFKGSGFYITDYGKDGKKDRATAPKRDDAAEPGGDGAKKDTGAGATPSAEGAGTAGGGATPGAATSGGPAAGPSPASPAG